MTKPPYNKWNIIKAFYQKNQWKVLLVFWVGILSNIFTILIPISLGKYFDLTFGFQSHRAAFLDQLPFSFWEDMGTFLLYMSVLVFLSFALHFVQRFQTGVLGEKFVKNLREQLFAQQLKIKVKVYSDKGKGKYLLRHSADFRSIQNYLTKGIIRFSTDLVLVGLTLLVLLYLDVNIFIAAVLGLLITIAAVAFLNNLLFHASLKRRNTRAGLLSFVNDQLRSINTVKAFNKAYTEEKKYAKRSDRLLSHGIEFQKIYNLIFTLVPAFFYFNLVAILYIVHRQSAAQNGIAPENMLAVVFLLITILPVFRRIIRVSTTWELGNISFEKLINVFELESDGEQQGEKPFHLHGGEIEFRGVNFAYGDQEPVFEDLSFTTQALSINHFALGNGKGKSTLVKLISGLTQPTRGEILVDAQNINSLNTKSFLKKITFISPEFPLLGKSVFDAVSYSRKVKNKAKAQYFLDYFQEGLLEEAQLKLTDRIVDGGANLSQAQIKMLSYVRAAMTNKPIVVIENPLQQLDSRVRRNVIQWINDLEGKATVLLICKSWQANLVNDTHAILQ